MNHSFADFSYYFSRHLGNGANKSLKHSFADFSYYLPRHLRNGAKNARLYISRISCFCLHCFLTGVGGWQVGAWLAR
jgi:hypothetical protein